MKIKELLTEGILQVADELKDSLNAKVYEVTGVSNWGDRPVFLLFDIKGQGMNVWTRGDGSRYKEPGQIYITNEEWTHYKKKYQKVTDYFGSKQDAIKWAFDQLQQVPGATQMGAISGEMGSSEFDDAIILKNTIFVNRGEAITFQSKSVLRNLAIWRQEQDKS